MDIEPEYHFSVKHPTTHSHANWILTLGAGDQLSSKGKISRKRWSKKRRDEIRKGKALLDSTPGLSRFNQIKYPCSAHHQVQLGYQYRIVAVYSERFALHRLYLQRDTKITVFNTGCKTCTDYHMYHIVESWNISHVL